VALRLSSSSFSAFKSSGVKLARLRGLRGFGPGALGAPRLFGGFPTTSFMRCIVSSMIASHSSLTSNQRVERNHSLPARCGVVQLFPSLGNRDPCFFPYYALNPTKIVGADFLGRSRLFSEPLR